MTVGGELAHHGVKGMHWGQRSARDLVPTQQQIKTGAVAAAKATGKATVATAKFTGKAVVYAAHHKRMVAGAGVAGVILHDVGKVAYHAGATGILMKAAKNREAAMAAGKLATKALGSTAAKINYAKLARGAYKITTM